ncbi:dienelactone hydrolase family protein [Streptomyces sp. RB6PN25]|uniref:Dienelactone hydrolase family protein n=1 Tax=Streptomyces humicola TaxID=2953240 RepID=A0ABT1PWZ5_9ACTN|nr:dienelactone hydrolase family protein [Streptomyces humicola]MCQ4081505.1 dienelactone hydrolase family protein [Streptomyces humicola]
MGANETIILFHSMYGLRPAVHAAADRLRAAGHEVHVPDLFDGRTAQTPEEGVAIKDEIGREELLTRAVRAAAPHLGSASPMALRAGEVPPPEARGRRAGLVYAGFSLGGSVAQNLALADERARGLLLLHGTSDIADDAATDIPVQLHVAEPDPFEPDDWLNAWYLRMRRAGADVEVHRYRGAGHLYTDPELPDWDEEAAERTWSTALDFLADL